MILPMRSSVAALMTAYASLVLVLKMTSSGALNGTAIAARWTTASGAVFCRRR
jgi:hypothetical protein